MRKIKYLQDHILSENRTYVVGEYFTIIDGYLHIILSYTTYVHIEQCSAFLKNPIQLNFKLKIV